MYPLLKAPLRRVPFSFLIIRIAFCCLFLVLSTQYAVCATGFNGGTLLPANRFVCMGSSLSLTFTPSTCVLMSGPNWSATYFVDSSFDGGTSWHTPSGAATGTCSAASPIISYTTAIFTSAVPYTAYYRIRLTGLIASCAGASTYTSATATIATGASPSAITGPDEVCMGTTATLADGSIGGSWSSTASAVATIGTSGVVTSVSPGTTVISYSFPGGCSAHKTITVTAAPAISGSAHVCVGATALFLTSGSGSIWSSSAPVRGTIDPATGILTGISAGTTTISYGACPAPYITTIHPVPAAIVGASHACLGHSVLMTDGTSGGTWSGSAPGIATVSSSGTVTGVAPGTATISYSLSSGCFVSHIVTIDPLAPVSGTLSLCAGTSTAYTTTSTGGIWFCSNPAVATIDAATGVLTAVAAGVTDVWYGSCSATLTVTVNPGPTAITGISQVCLGSGVTLADATPGGTWSITPASVATISPTGVVTSVSAGTATVSYTIPNGCYALFVTTVVPLPILSGSANLCTGTSATYSSSTGTGSWACSTPAIGTINATTGIFTGIAPGIATISFTSFPGGCAASLMVTVSTVLAPIAGVASVCAGEGITLTDAIPGGTWSSSDIAIATVGAATGIISGVGAGTATISYATGASCAVSMVVTVMPLPGPVTGTLSVCQGDTVILGCSPLGGTWTSSSPTIATIDPSIGVVTGIAGGMAIITYTSPLSCRVTAMVTVIPLPDAGAISGPDIICAGSAASFTGSVSGGAWSSAPTSIVTIDAAGGATAVAPGSAIISYTVSIDCGSSPISAYATKVVTVQPTSIDPGIITGMDSVCLTTATTLTNTVVGGTWVSGDPAIASVSTSGIVTGASVGVTTIRYLVANTCAEDSASHLMNVVSCVDLVELQSGDEAFGIFPNPSDGNFVVNMPGLVTATTITIYDIMGNTVAERKISGPYMPVSFRLQGIIPGSYIVRIATASTVYRRQLTIY